MIYNREKGVIKTEPQGRESPQPYLMTVRPSQVYPRVDCVPTRVDLREANGTASGTPLPCGSIIIDIYTGLLNKTLLQLLQLLHNHIRLVLSYWQIVPNEKGDTHGEDATF